MSIKQLNKIMKLYYFHVLKALWNGQGEIKMYYGMSRVKKLPSGKRSIVVNFAWSQQLFSEHYKIISDLCIFSEYFSDYSFNFIMVPWFHYFSQ